MMACNYNVKLPDASATISTTTDRVVFTPTGTPGYSHPLNYFPKHLCVDAKAWTVMGPGVIMTHGRLLNQTNI